MKEIIIEQPGKLCGVRHGEKLLFLYKRVPAKKFAAKLHEETGDPVYNIKKSGAKILVFAATHLPVA